MGQSVMVVGAGIAGLSCAGALAEAGLEVRLVDKARGPGGRCSTRRHEGYRFDHGAQYFTARSPAFCGQVDRWRAQGCVDRWQGRLISIDPAGRRVPLPDQPDRLVGVPGMNSIAKKMAEGLSCHLSSRIVELQETRSGWRLGAESGESFESELLVMTPPPEQAADLLDPVAPDISQRVRRVVMRPCWALMLGFAENPVADFEGAFVAERPIGWMASSHGKAGREALNAWIVHASEAFSATHLETPAEVVSDRLFDAFCELTGQREEPTHRVVHRWRYARAADPLSVGTLADRSRGLWVAGDWCSGSRIEGAWLSGQAAADDLLAHLADRRRHR